MAIGVMLIAAFCHGVSLLIVAATAWGVETVERVVHPLTYLMIPLTGAFIAVWWFPAEVQEIALLNPTIHMFEIIREGQFGVAVPHHYSLGYALASIAIANVMGLIAMRAGRRHIALQ
jgi:capsular polysaccharide transport system permease protein